MRGEAGGGLGLQTVTRTEGLGGVGGGVAAEGRAGRDSEMLRIRADRSLRGSGGSGGPGLEGAGRRGQVRSAGCARPGRVPAGFPAWVREIQTDGRTACWS